MSRRYATMLFDLDGTLLDTIGLIKESMRYALERHLGYSPDEAALVAGVGTPLMEQVRAHVRAAGARPDEIDDVIVERVARTYVEHNLTHHDDHVAPYPGVVETLEALRAAGVRLGIVTSKPQATARRGLRVCGIEGEFEVVIGCDDVRRPKPDAEPVRRALADLGAGVEGALFVGDSPHDMAAGRAARVHTGAALWGPFEREALRPTDPSHWLDRVDLLATLV